jgi:hypothetical protein
MVIRTSPVSGLFTTKVPPEVKDKVWVIPRIVDAGSLGGVNRQQDIVSEQLVLLSGRKCRRHVTKGNDYLTSVRSNSVQDLVPLARLQVSEMLLDETIAHVKIGAGLNVNLDAFVRITRIFHSIRYAAGREQVRSSQGVNIASALNRLSAGVSVSLSLRSLRSCWLAF